MIDRHLVWYQTKLRPETQRLIRMIVLPKVVSTNTVKREDLETHWDFIFGHESIIEVIEENLKKSGAFICSKDLTVADIAIYCELTTVMMLTQQTSEDLHKRGFHETHRWLSKLAEFPQLSELNKRLEEVITENGLA